MADTPSAEQFTNISLGGKNAVGEMGVLKLSPPGVGWKTATSGQSVTVLVQDMKGSSWQRIGPRHFQLTFMIKGESTVKFVGFREGDFPKLSAFIKAHYKFDMVTIEPSTKGWNWGELKLDGSDLSFNVSNKVAFEIPLPDVSQCAITRNDVSLEFQQYDDGNKANCDSIVELRFHVPETHTNLPDAPAPADGEEINTPAEQLRQLVLSHADVMDESGGNGIVGFEPLSFLIPRGRFEVEMHSKYMKIEGKSYPWKLLYSSITRLSKLPYNERHCYLVISVSPPLRQGHTVYPHLVIQFNNEAFSEVEIKLTEEQFKNHPLLSPIMSGKTHKLVARVVKSLSGRKLYGPGSFKGSTSFAHVRCSLKANEGVLYPMEKAFLFLHKPPTYIPHNVIEYVEFSRLEGGSISSSRNFDMLIREQGGKSYPLKNIPKKEYNAIFNYANAKGLSIQGARSDYAMGSGMQTILSSDDEELGGEGGESSSDHEFVADESSDESSDPEEYEDMDEGDDDDDEEDEDDDYAENEEDMDDYTPKIKKITIKRKSVEQGGTKSKKAKKKKEKKKSSVKKARSAFIFFSSERRPQLKIEKPDLAFGDIARAVGAEWKELNADQKAKFEKMAADDKIRYEKEKAEEEAKENS